ncbi:MAG: hypothetical protein IJY24_05185, partial [Clostridia bacterium]|nr:hypothetical protein [Clostridia bacterium]
MKKTWRSILTLVLVLVMLFGVAAPTVAFAQEANGIEANSAGTETNSSTGGTENEAGGKLDTGWCVIEYDDNELKVTLYPDVDSLLDMNKASLKEMLNTLVDAIKTIVIDDLKQDIVDGQYGDGVEVDGSFSVDEIWKVVIDKYIATLDPAISEAEDTYVEFFKAAIADDTIVDGFVDYACKILRTAVKTGMFTVEELESYGADKIEDKVNDLFKDEVQKRLSQYVDEYVGIYLEWILYDGIHTEPELPDSIKKFIDDEVTIYLEEIALAYINGTLGSSSIEAILNDYINGQLDEFVKDVLADYATSNPHTSGHAKIDTLIDSKIDELVDDCLAGYFAYRFDGETEAPRFFDKIDAELREVIRQRELAAGVPEADVDAAVAVIYNDKALLQSEIDDEAIAEIVDKLLSEYVEADYTDIITEVIDQIKTNHEFDDTLEDEVHEILNEGNAVSVFHDILLHLDETNPGEIDKIETELKAEVESHTEFDVTLPPVDGDFRDRVFNAILGVGHGEFYNLLADYTDRLVAEYLVTLDDLKDVDTSISITDLISFITSVKVDGEMVYGDFGGGSGAVFNTQALKDIIKDLPRAADIAEMADDEMKLSYSFEVSTEFGTCDFVLTGVIGGGYDKIRTLARLVADHVDVYITSEGVYTANVRVPAKFSELVLRAAKSGQFSDALKQKIFAAFSADLNDAYALYNRLTFDDIIQLVQSINFEGILDSEFIKQYIDL